MSPRMELGPSDQVTAASGRVPSMLFICRLSASLGAAPVCSPWSLAQGGQALPGNPAEGRSGPGQTSQDDGARQSRNGEGSKVQWWTCPLGLLPVFSVIVLCWPGGLPAHRSSGLPRGRGP